MIELINFSKSYGKNSFGVTDSSLTVASGTVTGLIGPNGSGKTTIMKAICGFHFATDGKIILTDNKSISIDLAEFPEKAMELIGYVPENPCLPPDLTVQEFLYYAAETHCIAKENLKKEFDRVVKDCTLEKFVTKKIKTLSKGQKQRVSFAQALIHNPPNLILDEPISGLDPAQILQMRDLIQKLSKTKAILMSTHILQEIYSLCSSLYILNEGKIVTSGTEKEIITQTHSKSLEEAFIKLTSSSNL